MTSPLIGCNAPPKSTPTKSELSGLKPILSDGFRRKQSSRELKSITKTHASRAPIV
jgi:hypothetical protein